MGKFIQKERIGPYRCRKGILCKDDDDSLKKKDIVKSKVRGVEIEFDHEKSATILGIPGTMGSREYVKDVWEESKYIKPLEITGEEPKKYDFFQDTFLTMCKLTRENGIWWIEVEKIEEGMMTRHLRGRGIGEDEGNRVDFDLEAPLMRQPSRGNRGRGRSSMMSRKMLKALRNRSMRFQADTTTGLAQQKDKGIAESTPGPTSREADFPSFSVARTKEGKQIS
ncbi:hypothetical protein Dimus_022882 [Dionaea muscipula]